MIIFLRELNRNGKQFIIWTSVLVLCSVMMLVFFPLMADQAKVYNEMMKTFPKEVAAALNADKLDFSKILDYLAYIMPYILLFGGMYAAFLGAGILSKEEDEGTIEFLLAKPVKRNTIITFKLFCAAFYLILFNIIFAACNYFTIELIKGKSEYNIKAFLLISIGFLLFQLVFASVGLLISVFITRAKTVNPISIGIVFGTYFFSIAAAITDKLKNLNYLSPFKYVNPSDIVINVKINETYLIIMFSVIIVSIAATYIFYNKKDIAV